MNKTPKLLLLLSHWLKEKDIEHVVRHDNTTLDIDCCGFISKDANGEWVIWYRGAYWPEELHPEEPEFLSELDLDICGEIRNNKALGWVRRHQGWTRMGTIPYG